MDINDEAKDIVQEIGSAINQAVERSPEVAEAIERLREAGYEMELTLRLEIGLRALDEAPTRPKLKPPSTSRTTTATPSAA